MTTTATEVDEFEDPEPTKRVVTYDGWGRYKLPHPDTGREMGFTRVTTIAGALEDQYHLKMWDRRKMLEGLVIDRGPLTLAAQVFAEHGWDPQLKAAKDKLDEIAKHVLEIADTAAGAKIGTQLHLITEKDNQGESPLASVLANESGVRANLEAYRAALIKYQIEVLPQYMERLLFIPALNAVGRTDNLTREMGLELLRVFDLKSQKTLDFGALKIAVQLAMYANAQAMFNEDTWQWEEMPAVDRSVATVAWLPVRAGMDDEDKTCHLYDVDLEWGWRWARASVQTRTARKFKPLTLRVAPTMSLAASAPERPITPKAVPTGAAVVESGPVKLVPTQAPGEPSQEDPRALYGQIEDARTAGESGVDWEARFRQASTTEALATVGRECKAAGSLTPTLVELGKTLRKEIVKK